MPTERGTPGNPFRILLVEDNPGDVDLVIDALREGTPPHDVCVAPDGEAALAALCDRTQLPDLILLDLNVPKLDGREVIRAVKSNVELRHIPIAVLSSSEAEKDLVRVYASGANCMVTKPVDLHEFFGAIRSTVGFWLGTARLPPRVTGAEA